MRLLPDTGPVSLTYEEESAGHRVILLLLGQHGLLPELGVLVRLKVQSNLHLSNIFISKERVLVISNHLITELSIGVHVISGVIFILEEKGGLILRGGETEQREEERREPTRTSMTGPE